MNCPLCERAVIDTFFEEHVDPVEGKRYTIHRCANCQGDFSSPMATPSADWYAKAYPVRLLSATLRSDWRYARFFRRHPVNGGRLLDIGAGTGAFVLLAQRRGFDAAGVDFDARTIEWGVRQGAKQLTAMPIDSYLSRQPDGTWDWIVLFEVLEHVESPFRLLAETRRLLRPGGRVAIFIPNRNRPLLSGREEHDYPPHHLSRWTKHTLEVALKAHGFVLEYCDDGYIPARYLAHSLFDAVVKALLQLVRRKRPSNQPTVVGTQSIADPTVGAQEKRQRVVNLVRETFILVGSPFFFLIAFLYSRLFPHRGTLIYAEARRP